MFHPQLGVSLNCISNKLTPEALEVVSRSSIATFEIPSAFFQDDASEELRNMVKEGLQGRIASIHAQFGQRYDFSSLDERVHRKAIAEASKSIDLAIEFGASIVVFHLSAEPIEAAERPARIAQAQKGLAAIEQYGRNVSKKLAFELLPRTCLGNTVEEMLEMLCDCDAQTVGVCLDVNHGMERYQQIAADIRMLGDRLTTLHLSDYDGVDEKHWMPGKGVIDWNSVVNALREINYAGPFNYESTPEGETLEERIGEFEKNFAWLSAF